VVFLTFADWNAQSGAVEVSSYVQEVVENGGTCTLTLTQGADSVTASSAAQADASSTTCGDLVVARAKLAPGTWRAVVTYRSDKTRGTSDPAEVTVP
jgi:hypothetical protein